MSFLGWIFLGVLLLGTVEVYLLVVVARAMSFLGTVGLCVLTGVVGSGLVRLQGVRTIRDVQTALANGEAPTREIVAGLVLLFAGVLLIVPGFISDGIGFLALIPALRRRLAARIARALEGRIAPGVFPPGSRSGPLPRGGRIIDVDPED